MTWLVFCHLATALMLSGLAFLVDSTKWLRNTLATVAVLFFVMAIIGSLNQLAQVTQ